MSHGRRFIAWGRKREKGTLRIEKKNFSLPSSFSSSPTERNPLRNNPPPPPNDRRCLCRKQFVDTRAVGKGTEERKRKIVTQPEPPPCISPGPTRFPDPFPAGTQTPTGGTNAKGGDTMPAKQKCYIRTKKKPRDLKVRFRGKKIGFI